MSGMDTKITQKSRLGVPPGLAGAVGEHRVLSGELRRGGRLVFGGAFLPKRAAWFI